MKYTKSKDGQERCTVHLEMRLSKEEYQELFQMAKLTGLGTVKKYLSIILLDHEHLYYCMKEDRCTYSE
jgi:hypothetical protein